MRSSFHRRASTILRVLVTLFVIELLRLLRLYRSVQGNKRYWQERASLPAQRGDFVYVALGDSVANAIGASRPLKGYVGLMARAVEERTGRRVRIINLSVTGATAADVLRDQVPQLSQLQPDLVTLDVGANDVNKRLPEDSFVRDFTAILDQLPAGRTIVADLPIFQHGPQQSTLHRLNALMREQVRAHGCTLAPIFEVTSASIHDLRTYGADFFHPSDRGHRNWYRAFESQLDAIL